MALGLGQSCILETKSPQCINQNISGVRITEIAFASAACERTWLELGMDREITAEETLNILKEAKQEALVSVLEAGPTKAFGATKRVFQSRLTESVRGPDEKPQPLVKASLPSLGKARRISKVNKFHF